MSAPIGEVLLTDCNVHELPEECSSESALETSTIIININEGLISF